MLAAEGVLQLKNKTFRQKKVLIKLLSIGMGDWHSSSHTNVETLFDRQAFIVGLIMHHHLNNHNTWIKIMANELIKECSIRLNWWGMPDRGKERDGQADGKGDGWQKRHINSPTLRQLIDGWQGWKDGDAGPPMKRERERRAISQRRRWMGGEILMALPSDLMMLYDSEY